MRLALVTVLAMVTSMGAMAQRHHGGGYYQPGDFSIGGIGHHHQQRERLHLNVQQHLRGQNTIGLKRLLRQQYPGLSPKDLELRAVVVKAKSKRGNGEITLQVGQDESYPKIAPMSMGRHVDSFHNMRPRTFSRIRLRNPSFDSVGKWQLHTKGNIKILDITMVVMHANSAQTIVVPVHQQIQGFGTLKLKRLIKQQNPHIDLQDAQLESVQLIAKSKRGRGQATLVMGHSAGYPSTVDGHPRAFDRNGPGSYNVTSLDLPYSQSGMGKWQVELQGQIKVKEVVVTIKSKSQPDNGGFGGGRNGGRRNQGRRN